VANADRTWIGRSLWHDWSVDAPSSLSGGYRLDQLGWLQFERLAALVLEAEAGLHDLDWVDRAYRGRVARVEGPLVLAGAGVRLPGPAVVVVAWIPDRLALPGRCSALVGLLVGWAADLGLGSADRVLVITNLDAKAAGSALSGALAASLGRVVVVGAHELSESLDRHPAPSLAEQIIVRLRHLVPESATWAVQRRRRISPARERWWVPHDIEAPPTADRVIPARPAFTRDEVDRVLSDL
jgi:hypothetical protein